MPLWLLYAVLVACAFLLTLALLFRLGAAVHSPAGVQYVRMAAAVADTEATVGAALLGPVCAALQQAAGWRSQCRMWHKEPADDEKG